MKRKEALRQLDLGQTVAEFETDLKHYFVETETFRSLVQSKVDIVAGDKGTGKSALFKILRERYVEEPTLKGVEVIPAFNVSGDPIFKRLTEGEVLSEGQYRTIWKTYVLALTGNWLLLRFKDQWTPSMKKLDVLLQRLDLREFDPTPKGTFSHLVDLVKRIVKFKKAGVEITFDEAGVPITTPHIELGEIESEDEPTLIRHTESLGLLNDALVEADLSAWLVLDRLDEAFAGSILVEIPALRALFRTYLDLTEFEQIRLKMFVRRDLFRRITEGEFVNLTHINARKVEIVWDDHDLLDLLIRRVRANPGFMETTQLTDKSNTEIFNLLFPDQVEEGSRRPKTLQWMLSRIRDGLYVKPPRNLIDLVKKAQEEQLRIEEREPHEFIPGEPLFEPQAIRKAYGRLSQERVVDTLLAESGDLRSIIESFRDGKAEHNFESMAMTIRRSFGASGSELKESGVRHAIKMLVDMGFIERVKQSETYKIPMLYREGLNITQGKAFQPPDEQLLEEDED